MPDKRLIDANALYDTISDVASLAHHDVMSVKNVLELIDTARAVDAVPVVHAMWIREPRGVVRCSYCGKGYRLTNGGANVLKFFYCPNCGAKIDGCAQC